MLRVLKGMLDAEAADDLENAELVCDGGQCWRGDDHTSPATVKRLLQLTLVSPSSWGGGSDIYLLNDFGRATLRRPELASEIEKALLAGRPFTLSSDDRLVAMEAKIPPVPAMLAGSHRRGSGGVVHALRGPFDWNYIGAALCGAKPGARSAGWAPYPDLQVTCGKCMRKMMESDSAA
jgi:hypothetical protein